MPALQNIFFSFLILPLLCVSQTDSAVYLHRLYSDLIPHKKYEYSTIYGSKKTGTLLRVDNERIIFYDDNISDSIRVLKYEIVSIRPAIGSIPGSAKLKKYFPRPWYDTRYFFTENALPMDSCYSVMHSHYAGFNELHFKINNSFSIHSHLIVVIPLSLGVRYIKKFHDRHYFGVSLTTMYFPNTDTMSPDPNSKNNKTTRIIFPAISNFNVRYTQGNIFKNFTVGASVLLFHPDLLNVFYDNNKQFTTYRITYGLYAAASNQILNRWVLNGEILFFAPSFAYGLVGTRYIFKKYFSAQAGLGTFFNSNFRYNSSGKISYSFFFLPYVSFTFSAFSKR